MPRKTRQQKKLADTRKLIADKSPTVVKIKPTAISFDNMEQKSNLDSAAKFIITDLKKTLILSSLLFALEFLVFYAKLMLISK